MHCAIASACAVIDIRNKHCLPVSLPSGGFGGPQRPPLLECPRGSGAGGEKPAGPRLPGPAPLPSLQAVVPARESTSGAPPGRGARPGPEEHPERRGDGRRPTGGARAGGRRGGLGGRPAPDPSEQSLPQHVHRHPHPAEDVGQAVQALRRHPQDSQDRGELAQRGEGARGRRRRPTVRFCDVVRVGLFSWEL